MACAAGRTQQHATVASLDLHILCSIAPTSTHPFNSLTHSFIHPLRHSLSLVFATRDLRSFFLPTYPRGLYWYYNFSFFHQMPSVSSVHSSYGPRSTPISMVPTRNHSFLARLRAYCYRERKEWKGTLFSVRRLVEAAWVVVLWWGERRVFQSAIEACQWDRWEDWVFAP